MVAVSELVFVGVLVLLGYLWYRRTPMHQARRSHPVVPGQQASRVDFGMYQPSRPTPPPASLHGHERSRRGVRERLRHSDVRMWWRCLAKALGMGFLAYFAGNVAQELHDQGCPVWEPQCQSPSPSEAHVLMFTMLVFVVAFCAFLVRAYRRKSVWRP